MQLAWCRYQKDGKSDTRMFVILQTSNDIIACLDSDVLQEADIAMIRQLSHILEKMDLDGKISMFKDRMPDIMKAYRTLNKNNLVIYRTWPIKAI